MSNKKWEKLWEVDKFIRKLKPNRMTAGTETLLTIEFICGFELFNTRPYHNYEDWGSGYRISDGVITVESEDLDDALKLFKRKMDEKTV
jgi:hypothetical protein